jgi:hypothetical protein
MITRLANVIYWFCCIAAIVIAFYAYTDAWNENERMKIDPEHGLFLFIAVFCGSPVYLIGLAIRYILTGRGWRRKKP